VSVRPITPAALADELADRLTALLPSKRLRVAVDGSPGAGAAELADALDERIRASGRAALRASAIDFLRPASVRLEHGRTDPDAYLTDRLDLGALRRELLDPAGPGGSGRVLRRLWNPVTDRAYRAGYVELPPAAVVLLDGELLLGRGLPFDYTVHLRVSSGALARRLPAELGWTLPAYRRYAAEFQPERHADAVVYADHPERPALLAADP
jgi:hypothetical protein